MRGQKRWDETRDLHLYKFDIVTRGRGTPKTNPSQLPSGTVLESSVFPSF